MVHHLLSFHFFLEAHDWFEDEPTWRCQSNPLIRALGIQEPVIPGEPLIKGKPMTPGMKTGSYDPKVKSLFFFRKGTDTSFQQLRLQLAIKTKEKAS